jgi:hypothetical protein
VNNKPVEIAQPIKNPILGLPGVTAFGCRYTLQKCFLASASAFTLNTGMPFHRSRVQRWFENTEPLWWSVIVKKDADHQKRTLRSWTNRRLRIAFTESLKKKGFAQDGSPLGGGEGQGKGPIYGTLQIKPKPEVKKASMEDLISQTDELVKKLVERQPWATKKTGGGSLSRKNPKPGKPPNPHNKGKFTNRPLKPRNGF